MLVIINCGITGTVMKEGIHIKDITFSLYCDSVVLGLRNYVGGDTIGYIDMWKRFLFWKNCLNLTFCTPSMLLCGI